MSVIGNDGRSYSTQEAADKANARMLSQQQQIAGTKTPAQAQAEKDAATAKALQSSTTINRYAAETPSQVQAQQNINQKYNLQPGTGLSGPGGLAPEPARTQVIPSTGPTPQNPMKPVSAQGANTPIASPTLPATTTPVYKPQTSQFVTPQKTATGSQFTDLTKMPGQRNGGSMSDYIARGKQETGDDQFTRYSTPEEALANGDVQGFLMLGGDYSQLSPEQVIGAQTQAVQQQGEDQNQMTNELYDSQRNNLAQKQDQLQQELIAKKAEEEAANADALNKFKADQAAQIADATRQIENSANQRQEQADLSLSFQGFGRSTKAAELRDNIRQDTQSQIADINRQSDRAVNEYQASLLDKTNTKLEKLQARIDTYDTEKDKVEFEKTKAQQDLQISLMKANPLSPVNLMDTMEKMAKTKADLAKADADEKKAMREDAMKVFENAVKYGYTPEALSDEAKQNIASSLGIPTSALKSVIEKATTAEANKDMQVSYQTDADGNVTAVMYDKRTGQFSTNDLGGIGKSEITRYQAVIDPITGQSRVFDPIRGAFLDGGGGGTPGYNQPTQPGPGKVVVTATTQNTPANLRNNCVFFARSIVKDLPIGLVTSQQKRNMINTTVPQAGAVAMMPKFGDPKIGHVAVVEQVFNDGTVQIVEANVKNGPNGKEISRRRGTPQQLGIEGYWSGGLAKSNNYKMPMATSAEKQNANQTYPTVDPSQYVGGQELGFEKALKSGATVDEKSAYREYLTLTGAQPSDQTYGDFIGKYRNAQAGGKTSLSGLSDTAKDNIAKTTTALKSLDQLESALGSGYSPQYFDSNTPLIGNFMGSTPYTVAENLLIENIGRLQSGGAIGAQEVQNFKNLLPKAADPDEIRKQKIQMARDFLNEKLSVYGQNTFQGQQSPQPQQQASDPQVASMIKYDLAQGHNAQDIVNAMMKNGYSEQIQDARSKGYTDEEILQYYSQ